MFISTLLEAFIKNSSFHLTLLAFFYTPTLELTLDPAFTPTLSPTITFIFIKKLCYQLIKYIQQLSNCLHKTKLEQVKILTFKGTFLKLNFLSYILEIFI